MNKIDKYIFFEISKSCLFILFIFLSISWLLQFTRLVSLTNLIQVDIFSILYLLVYHTKLLAQMRKLRGEIKQLQKQLDQEQGKNQKLEAIQSQI